VKKRFISIVAIGMSLLAAGCAVSEPPESEAREEQASIAPANEVATDPAPVEYCEDLNGTSCVRGTTRTCFLKYDAMWSDCMCLRTLRWSCAL
jgi:hypothetical protein